MAALHLKDYIHSVIRMASTIKVSKQFSDLPPLYISDIASRRHVKIYSQDPEKSLMTLFDLQLLIKNEKANPIVLFSPPGNFVITCAH
jgi:hypothetical protein